MVVDILDGEHPPPAFLKLYDRRFADQLRRDNGIDEWTCEMEQAYIQSIWDGSVDGFLHNLHNIPYFQEDTEENWTDAQNEAYLADELLKFFKAEVAAYDALHEQQGKSVPKLLAAVYLDLTPKASSTTTADVTTKATNFLDFQPFQIKGILVQHIEGFNLRQVPEHCPRSTWQDIIDQAVSIARLLGDHNILNRDVRTENFIVSPSADGQEGQPYYVYMIDHSRIRGKAETDLERGRAKYSKGEDDAVGLVMQMILKRDYGFELHYERSERYLEWADTDVSLPEGTVRRELRPGV